VLSAAMLLKYGLNEPEAAQLVEAAVVQVLDDNYRTGDIMSPGMTPVGCQAMGELLVKAVS
jgi:3-isopropylmalate dehydrogenase